jgi:hypothetical protein
MGKAFIIGNGKSRIGFDLLLLKHNGTVFGCNALYRDFDVCNYALPDYLVAIDPKMQEEIDMSDFPRPRIIFPPEEECWEPKEYNPNRPRSNAGMNAVLEAIKRDFNEIYCLGFDFLLYDDIGSISNVYDGTNAYESDVRCSLSDSRNRMGYLGYVLEKNKNIDFTFVYRSYDKIYKPALDNFNLLHYEDFVKTLKR